MIYDKHIFICVNQRPEGAPRPSCGEEHGMAVVNTFKEKLKAMKLPIRVRAQKSGCLDICNFGQTLVIYPQGIFYVGVGTEDVDEIIEESIINDRLVDRLLLENARKKL